MLKISTLLFLSFIFTTAALGEPLKIGVVLPLTGGFSDSGISLKNSILLNQEDFKTSDLVRFIFEDNQFEPKNTVTAVNKFINVDKVHGLIVWGTPTSLSVNGIAERAGVPLVAISMVNRVVADKKFVVKHWLPLEEISFRVNEEVERRGIKSVVVAALQNDAMIALKESFLSGRKAEVLTSLDFDPADADFRTAAARIKALNPEGVYVLLWSPQLSLFSKQLRQVGYKGIIFGTQNMENLNEIKLAQGSLDGSWYVGTDDRSAGEYFSRYRVKHNSDPVAGGVNGYDVAGMIAQCAKAGEGKLNSCLHEIKDYKGALGIYSATGRNDFAVKGAIKCVVDGQLRSDGC